MNIVIENSVVLCVPERASVKLCVTKLDNTELHGEISQSFTEKKNNL